jgi:hypothetical protein
VVLDGQRRFTVVEIAGVVDVTLRGLTIMRGDSGGAEMPAPDNGGGLRITGGASVTVDGCVFQDCHSATLSSDNCCYGGAIDVRGTSIAPGTSAGRIIALSRLLVTGGTLIRNSTDPPVTRVRVNMSTS